MGVAEVYGEVLFDLSKESDNIDLFFNKIKFIDENILSEQDFLNFILNPDINFDDKRNFLCRFVVKSCDFAGRCILNFFLVLLDRNRFTEIKSIVSSFYDFYYDYKNILRVNVFSKVSLSDKILFDIELFLKKKYDKEIYLKNIIDNEIIAGFIIEFKGVTIDCSFNKELNDFKKSLYRIDF